MVKTCEGFTVERLKCKNKIREGENFCWCHKSRVGKVVEAAKTDARNEYQARLNLKMAELTVGKKVASITDAGILITDAGIFVMKLN
jgi:hypothetical protein